MDPAYQAYYNPTSAYLAWEVLRPGSTRRPARVGQPASCSPPVVKPAQPMSARAKGDVLFLAVSFVICAVLDSVVHPLWMGVWVLLLVLMILHDTHPVAYHAMNLAVSTANIAHIHKENKHYAGKTIGRNAANDIAMDINVAGAANSAAWLYKHYRDEKGT